MVPAGVTSIHVQLALPEADDPRCGLHSAELLNTSCAVSCGDVVLDSVQQYNTRRSVKIFASTLSKRNMAGGEMYTDPVGSRVAVLLCDQDTKLNCRTYPPRRNYS